MDSSNITEPARLADRLSEWASSQAITPKDAADFSEAASILRAVSQARASGYHPHWPFPQKVDAAGWVTHHGAVYALPGGRTGHQPMPVPPGTPITVRFRDGETHTTSNPEYMRWGWTRPYVANADIVAWRPA